MRFGKRMKNILQIIGNLRVHVENLNWVESRRSRVKGTLLIRRISRRANLRMPCPPQEGADFCSRNRKIVAQIVRFWQIERLLIQTLTRSATALVRSTLVQRPAGNVRECAP